MGILQRVVVLLVLASLFISMLALPGDARIEARYELRSGDAIFGNDFYTSSNIQTLFHQQSLDELDRERAGLSFPGALDFNQADSPGDGVDIALPSLHQDTTQAYTADATGFFSANYIYRPETDFGNVPLSPGYAASLQQAIRPAAPVIMPLSPEQYDTIAIRKKLKKAQAAATPSPTPANKSIEINSQAANATGMEVNGPGTKTSYSLNLLGPKNAESEPEIPLLYPSDFDMIDKNQPAFPNPGIGTLSTNGAGSVGASLTGPIAVNTGRPANNTVNKTGNKTANQTANQTKPVETKPYNLNYADFNFDASTQQINNMTLLERMWRNSHRGGTMGKAYAGDTSAPLWIDPYERPNDVSMIDEHWYALQSALNMTVPGTQIMPRFWSLMF